MVKTEIPWTKKLRARLPTAVPLTWRFRRQVASRHGVPEFLWQPLRDVERRVVERNFEQKFGKKPRLDDPRSFNEKMQWRKLYDRRSFWPVVVDKYRVRDFVRGRTDEVLLIPLLHETRSPGTIPFDSFEAPYIIKPNHMSGRVFPVRDPGSLVPRKRQDIVEFLYWCLCNRHGLALVEWAYSVVQPRILVEQLLMGEDGKIPRDFKIHCFSGDPQFIQVDVKRFSDHVRTVYDRDWNRLDLTLEYPRGPEIERPETLSLMLKIAADLSRDTDYLRVDLYSIAGEVYFGELTPYHESGLGRFRPEKWDLDWGKRWTLPNPNRDVETTV